jgi:hypothetical protein
VFRNHCQIIRADHHRAHSMTLASTFLSMSLHHHVVANSFSRYLALVEKVCQSHRAL